MSQVTNRRWLIAALLAAAVALLAAVPVAVNAQDEQGRKIKAKVQPEYPELARRMHLNGTVKLQVVVLPAGTAKTAKAVGGNPVLIDAAMDAVKKWHWEAGPAQTVEVVEFRFVAPE